MTTPHKLRLGSLTLTRLSGVPRDFETAPRLEQLPKPHRQVVLARDEGGAAWLMDPTVAGSTQDGRTTILVQRPGRVAHPSLGTLEVPVGAWDVRMSPMAPSAGDDETPVAE